eukprot:364556-Chlamydomonas_euryale.AAC.10
MATKTVHSGGENVALQPGQAHDQVIHVMACCEASTLTTEVPSLRMLSADDYSSLPLPTMPPACLSVPDCIARAVELHLLQPEYRLYGSRHSVLVYVTLRRCSVYGGSMAGSGAGLGAGSPLSIGWLMDCDPIWPGAGSGLAHGLARMRLAAVVGLLAVPVSWLLKIVLIV